MHDPTTYLDDIPEDLARRAHAGTSFVPQERAVTERQGYASTLARDYDTLAAFADTDAKRATLAAEFERYRQGYRERYVAMLEARSRCMSTMIAGPSKFSVRRQAKIGAVADARVADLVAFRKRALDAIAKVLQPERRPIATGDGDAAERIEAKIASLEKLQEVMKAANGCIRKHMRDGGDRAALLADLRALGLSDKNALAAVTPDPMGRVGFPAWALSNNSAEIRRLKARAAKVAEARAAEAVQVDGSIARFEDAPADNRVRLFFPGKPDAVTRARLKSCGFRWTPSLGCWQAFRNPKSIDDAKREAGIAVSASPSQRCACHDGGTCDVAHDPATCSCVQCVNAEAAS